MNRKDSSSTLADGGHHRRRIDIVGVRPNVGKDRCCASVNDTAGRSDEGEGCRYDLVSSSYSESFQSKEQSIAPTSHADCMPDPDVPGDLALQALDDGTENELAGFEHVSNSNLKLHGQRVLIASQMLQGHLHARLEADGCSADGQVLPPSLRIRELNRQRLLEIASSARITLRIELDPVIGSLPS